MPPAPSPLDSNAQGQAIFHIADDGLSFDYKLIASNIENIVQAHIHCGPSGVNGPIVVWLFPSPEDPVNCVGAECRPPPQCLVGLENCGVGVNLAPVRTFWRQTGVN